VANKKSISDKKVATINRQLKNDSDKKATINRWQKNNVSKQQQSTGGDQEGNSDKSIDNHPAVTKILQQSTGGDKKATGTVAIINQHRPRKATMTKKAKVAIINGRRKTK